MDSFVVLVCSATLLGCGPPLISIRTTPPGAYVYVYGQLVGQTPTRLADDQPVQLYLPGFAVVTVQRAELHEYGDYEIEIDNGPHPVIRRPYNERSVDLELTPVPAASPPSHPRPTTPAASEEARQQAWRLTKTAIDAAHAGECGTVRELETKIREADAKIHDAVFAHEIAISRCLGAKQAESLP